MMNLDLIQLARAGGRSALNEMEGKALLAGYGIDVPHSVRVADASEVDRRTADMTPPFALKVLSADILHKSDAGGVRLGLEGAAAVKAAIDAGAEAAGNYGEVISAHVIARPHDDIASVVPAKKKSSK